MLRDVGFGEWSYCTGRRNGKHHAWSEQDGVIVDLTADQFDDQDERVIVTRDRKWHDSFGRVSPHVVPLPGDLYGDYGLLKERLADLDLTGINHRR